MAAADRKLLADHDKKRLSETEVLIYDLRGKCPHKETGASDSQVNYDWAVDGLASVS